jgi:cell wall-associated NlpC family hydrolase
MRTTFDRRRTPARPDLAAAHLRGKVEAGRFVEGVTKRIVHEAVNIRPHPAMDASLDTQALFGERVRVYEDEDGWIWGQLERDGYVGYFDATALADVEKPTHRVCVPRTFVYPGLSMKLPVVMALPMNAGIEIVAMRGDFAEARNIGCIWAAHLRPLGEHEPDFVAVAERFLNVPYLWGGKSFAGLDCSGLMQISLQAAGVDAPRDTDMQATELGEPIAFDGTLSGLQRGDLIFWKGHVGVMRDAQTLLHANGHHMMVASEPLREARDRIQQKSFGAITTIKRISR